MSNIIKLKTGSGVPTQNDLVENEVGISTSTYRLYQGRNGSAPVQIGTEIFSGEGVPSDDIGKNGDLYIQLDSITTTSNVEQLNTTNGESTFAATAKNDLSQLSSTNLSEVSQTPTNNVKEATIIAPENLYIKSAFDGSDSDIPKTISSFNGIVESEHSFSSTIANFWKYTEAIASSTGSSNISYNFGFDENTESYHISLNSNNSLAAFLVNLGAGGDDAFLYFGNELYPKMLADSSIDDVYVVSIDYKKTVGEIVYPPELIEEDIAAIKEQSKTYFSNLHSEYIYGNIITILDGDGLLEDTGEEFVTKKIRFKFKMNISDFANATAFAGVVGGFCGLSLLEYVYSTYDLYFKNMQFYKESSGSSATEQTHNIIKLKSGSGVPTQDDLIENEVGISSSTNRLYQGGADSPISIGLEVFAGQDDPDNTQGKNGDLYIKIAE